MSKQSINVKTINQRQNNKSPLGHEHFNSYRPIKWKVRKFCIFIVFTIPHYEQDE